ncbi:MAG: AMP-binding protein, partial [Alphaproteobacteria bacterium]|nr:AMP-binding protein [Alphaproteobacteria bacterium]
MSEPWAPGGETAHVDHFAAENLPPKAAWPRIDFTGLPDLAAFPDRINCATELLDKMARRHPHRAALHGADFTWSYGELLDKANRIANILVGELGVRPGNRVMLRSGNNPMYAACWFAVMKVGAVAVATMPLLRARELTYMADFARVRVALCDARLAEEMEATRQGAAELRDVVYFHAEAEDGLEARMASQSNQYDNIDTAADDVCIIAFTSGTTGQPKGCMHFHRDVMAVCETSSKQIVKPRADDIFAGTPPLAFTFGLGGLILFPLQVGASSLLLESYTPDGLIAAVNRHRITVLFTA